jgi:hypothetical protein
MILLYLVLIRIINTFYGTMNEKTSHNNRGRDMPHAYVHIPHPQPLLMQHLLTV